MNYLFLDIDGVLFHLGGIIYHRLQKKEEREPRKELSVESLALLCRFLKDFPNTQIIISSTWRRSHTMEEIKTALGPEISAFVVGITPSLNRPRGEEIKNWLDANAPGWHPNDVLILDDDSDMNPLMGCLFNTDAHNGFNATAWIELENFVKSTPTQKRNTRWKKALGFNLRNTYYRIKFKIRMVLWRFKKRS